jgi:DNA-binding transcriptional regulator GbsR (MarR family)
VTATSPTVSPATEQKLRSAMARLLTQATRTDGKLTKTNLAREAGVSRATMNRATTVLAEWNTAVTNHRPPSREKARIEDEIRPLKATIKNLRADNAELRAQNQAAATVIAELHAQLQTRRDMATTVTPLETRTPRRPRRP